MILEENLMLQLEMFIFLLVILMVEWLMVLRWLLCQVLQLLIIPLDSLNKKIRVLNCSSQLSINTLFLLLISLFWVSIIKMLQLNGWMILRWLYNWRFLLIRVFWSLMCLLIMMYIELNYWLIGLLKLRHVQGKKKGKGGM